jgi:ABC-2 type transport system permease protein
MRQIEAIFGKEMKSYFVSPIAYVVIAVFLVISGYFFYGMLSSFVQLCIRANLQAHYYRMAPPKLNVNEWVIRPLFHNLSVIGIFMLPLITMRLYSEEKRSGTMELLLTSPITRSQTLLGKFLAALALYGVMIGVTLFHQIFLFGYGNPEAGPILSGYIGLLLEGAAFLSVGLLISSLTKNQIIAAVGSFGAFLILWAIGWLSDFTGPGLGKVLSSLSLIDHFDNFAKGIIDTSDLVFYLCFIFLGLFLTYRSVESGRWR